MRFQIRCMLHVVYYYVVREVDYRPALNTKNMLEAKEEICQLKMIVNRLIESVAKQDEKAISNLFRTNFVRCFLHKTMCCSIQINSNCIEGKVFKGGRWIPIKSDTDSISYNTYKNMTLFESFDELIISLNSK